MVCGGRSTSALTAPGRFHCVHTAALGAPRAARRAPGARWSGQRRDSNRIRGGRWFDQLPIRGPQAEPSSGRALVRSAETVQKVETVRKTDWDRPCVPVEQLSVRGRIPGVHSQTNCLPQFRSQTASAYHSLFPSSVRRTTGTQQKGLNETRLLRSASVSRSSGTRALKNETVHQILKVQTSAFVLTHYHFWLRQERAFGGWTMPLNPSPRKASVYGLDFSSLRVRRFESLSLRQKFSTPLRLNLRQGRRLSTARPSSSPWIIPAIFVRSAYFLAGNSTSLTVSVRV